MRLTFLPALLLFFHPVLAACGGGGGGGGGDQIAPAQLTYDTSAGVYRVSELIKPNQATLTGGAATYSVDPALPAGLDLDPLTGEISGTPTAEAAATDYTVTAANAAGSTTATVNIVVGAALPAAFLSLASGFVAEPVVQGNTKVAKMALAPDGRIFFNEVDAGEVRVIDPANGLLPTPYASLTVAQGGHRGLLGLALAPDFAQSGFVYVMATVPGPNLGDPDRSVVLRFTDDPVNNVGTNGTLKIDNLPASNINNGGELLFDSLGHLWVSVGDAENPVNSQVAATVSLAGKILRYDVFDAANPDVPATIPLDNPDPQSPEWCRGLRNTFGLAMHPATGGLFGVDNGPTGNDELNFLESGMNFQWGAQNTTPPEGTRILTYADVIVPTAVAWHTGTGWGAAFADNLFLTSYDDQAIRRFQGTGPNMTQLDDEEIWAEFALQADDNKPLDVVIDPVTGNMYIATFKGIWRIRKL